MSARHPSRLERPVPTQVDVNHLRREARTALELAIAALAPSELVDRLAVVAGLIEAISELPADSPPALALLPKTLVRAHGALVDWHAWKNKHLPKGVA